MDLDKIIVHVQLFCLSSSYLIRYDELTKKILKIK